VARSRPGDRRKLDRRRSRFGRASADQAGPPPRWQVGWPIGPDRWPAGHGDDRSAAGGALGGSDRCHGNVWFGGSSEQDLDADGRRERRSTTRCGDTATAVDGSGRRTTGVPLPVRSSAARGRSARQLIHREQLRALVHWRSAPRQRCGPSVARTGWVRRGDPNSVRRSSFRMSRASGTPGPQRWFVRATAEPDGWCQRIRRSRIPTTVADEPAVAGVIDHEQASRSS
jgi:hypothetical protein